MFTTPLSGFGDLGSHDETLDDLGLGKHGAYPLGPLDTHLLPHTMGSLGYPSSGQLFLDEGFEAGSTENYLPEPQVKEELEDGPPTIWSAPLPSAVALSDEELQKIQKLQVGLYHKTRGGRNTFGAISGDAMVRVTKGVGKRLQLRVEFSPAQQAFLLQTMAPGSPHPFMWPNFSVTLEEISLANGAVLSEKLCEVDMTELLTLVSPAPAGSNEEPTFEPACDRYDPNLPLVAQCELKLFHLSKTLRFRVEYTTPQMVLSGHSMTFFTHDSGKSKKVAFTNTKSTNPDTVPPVAPANAQNSSLSAVSSQTGPSASNKHQIQSNNAMHPSQHLLQPQNGLYGHQTNPTAMASAAPLPSQHVAHNAAVPPFHLPAQHTLPHDWLDAHDVSSTTSTFSPSGEHDESSSHSSHTSPHPYHYHMAHPSVLDLQGHENHYLQSYNLSSSPSESDDTPHLLMQPPQHLTHNAIPEATMQARSAKSSKKHPNHPRSVQHGTIGIAHAQALNHTFEMSDEGHLEASSSSSCSGSGFLTPSDSSTLMDTDTVSREFGSDHESAHTISSHPGSIESGGGGYLEAPQFSGSSARPRSANGSASSSFSSDDGSAHMQTYGSRKKREAKARSKSRRSPTAQHNASPSFHSADSSPSSSTATMGSRMSSGSTVSFDPLDEEIDRKLNGRSSSKKRKQGEMMAVPVPGSDFPYKVEGNLDVQGVVRAQAFVHFSDIRFKTNVEDITDALNIVSQLKGKKYEWKDNINGAPTSAPLSGGRKVIGLIAQEVKRVLPEVVVSDKNGFLSLNYTDMVPVLIEALKQHVEATKAEKTEIQDSISELRAKVDELSQRSGDLTDTSSYLEFSDDEFDEDDDWESSLSESHGSYSRSTSNSFRRLSRGSSTSSLGANEGDLTASSASLPDCEVPLGKSPIKSSSLRVSDPKPHVHANGNVPMVGTSPGSGVRRPDNGVSATGTPRKTAPPAARKMSSSALLPPRPFVTLVACMTHRRLASLGSVQNGASASPSPFTILAFPQQMFGSATSSVNAPTAAHTASPGRPGTSSNASSAPTLASSTSSSSRNTSSSSGLKKSESLAAVSRNREGSITQPASSSAAQPSPLVSSASGSSLSTSGAVASSSPAPVFTTATSSNNASPAPSSNPLTSSGSKEKEKEGKESAPGSTKRTATQRLSRGFTSLLHHIQASTSNIMNSAKQLSSSSSSSSSSAAAAAAAAASSSSQTSTSTSAKDHEEGVSSDGEANLSSSSSSVSSGGSVSSNIHQAQLYSLSQQMSALSLSSSASEVRAQVLTPGFTRITPANPIKSPRTVLRAVVVTVSAWHVWSNSDEEKLFLDDTDARHSLVITGKAVSQIESSFPECTYIHTVSIDMRGTVQQTVEDVLFEISRRQVPSCDAASTPTASSANGSTNGTNGMMATMQSQLEQADLVWFVGHSQGVQACVHLCDRLLRSGVLSSGEQMLNILSLGGLHNSCAYSLMSLHGNPSVYAGLHNFGNSRRNFREYKQALGRLLETGVPDDDGWCLPRHVGEYDLLELGLCETSQYSSYFDGAS